VFCGENDAAVYIHMHGDGIKEPPVLLSSAVFVAA